KRKREDQILIKSEKFEHTVYDKFMHIKEESNTHMNVEIVVDVLQIIIELGK
ncbi:1899_t:CDS:1, partial [Racocetra persica]